MSYIERVRNWLADQAAKVSEGLAVKSVSVGRPGDGVSRRLTDDVAWNLDRDYGVLHQQFRDVRLLEKTNPLTKRIISVITASVIGKLGITISSNDETLNDFITEFMDENSMNLRQPDWCSELTRSGELFIALHYQGDTGMSLVRLIPAIKIDRIVTASEDYEMELEYHEVGLLSGSGTTWYSPYHSKVSDSSIPIVLHYAINRAPGELRGTSDLASIITWLQRYNKLLEGRVILNLAIRSFVWIVSIPTKFWERRKNAYKSAPAPGSILTVPEGEKVSAVAPNLQARDFRQDRVALLEMISSGTPGLTPLDFGDLETSNMSTAQVVERAKEAILAQRQALFAHIIADVTLHAYNRGVEFGAIGGETQSQRAFESVLPDILKQDNKALASSAKEIMEATDKLREQLGPSNALQRLILRLFSRFSDESLSDEEFEEISGALEEVISE